MSNTAVKPDGVPPLSAQTETVAQILKRERDPLIRDWFALVEKQEDLTAIPLTYEDRTRHLPKLLADVIARLCMVSPSKPYLSVTASHHGDLRRKQGYSAAMLVEESRILQVCLFTTLHKNSTRLDYDQLLPDIVTIADEVDVQLKHQMLRYISTNALET